MIKPLLMEKSYQNLYYCLSDQLLSSQQYSGASVARVIIVSDLQTLRTSLLGLILVKGKIFEKAY